MDEQSHSISEEWLSRLGGRDPSGWLGAFVESPKQAVADLLWNEFYFGPLNLIDRRQIITTWLDLLGNVEFFAQMLDRELAAWVKENWGRFERPAESLASAWSCLCSIVETSAHLIDESTLRTCAQQLREYFDEHSEFLGSFSTAPAADPWGAYLAAIAEFQGSDRSLAAFWHNLCKLPDGVPFYHARYAMLGLRRIRSAEPSVNGTLRAEVVRGLLNLATAFDRLAIEGKLEIDVARDTFRRIARQTEVAYRDSPGWARHGAREALELSARAQGWLTIIPPLARAMKQEQEKIQKGQPRPRLSIQANPNWSHTGREIGKRLKSGDRTSLPDARKLLEEERRYAEATGDTYDVSRSLRTFASGVHRFNPHLALRWAVEALQWEPYSHYSWTTVRTVFLVQRRVKEASQFAWVAWKRFPEDVEVHTALADVLNASGRSIEAEFIYRQAIEKFPDDIRPRNGLAATLGRLGKLSENEEEYRRGINSGFANTATFCGLANLVFEKGDREEAISLIEKALELEPDNTYALILRRKLTFQKEPILDEEDDWNQIPDVLSELSTFPTIEPGGGTREWEHGEDLVELSKAEQPRSINERPIQKETERKTEAASKSSGTASRELPTQSDPKRQNEDADEPETEVTNLEHPYEFKPGRAIVTAALVAEAYFYRTWARTTDGKLSARRRKVVLGLLSRAEDLSPQNAEVAAERAALIADEGNLTIARQRLTAKLETHPAAVSLLVLAARFDRVIAREEQRRHSQSNLAELCVIPEQLRKVDRALFHYQKGLAALALLDGDDRKLAAANSFSSFRRKLARLAVAQHPAGGASAERDRTERHRFYQWLEEHINRRVFDGITEGKEVSLAEITFLDNHWNERRSVIEEVEDFYVSHLSLGYISAELFSD